MLGESNERATGTGSTTTAPARFPRAKCLVAALLGVVLIGVLVTAPTQPPAPSTPMADPLQMRWETSAAPPSHLATIDASRFSNSQALSRVPTAALHSTPLFAREARPTPRVELAPLKVDAIYGAGDEHFAIVGSTIIRAGQPLPDGRKVLEVTAEGVKLER